MGIYRRLLFRNTRVKTVLNFALITVCTLITALCSDDPVINVSAQIFLAVLSHEGAHILTAYLLGVKINNVSFFPIGIRMDLASNEGTTYKVAAICLAGCIFGFASAGVLTFLCFERLDGYIFASLSLSSVNLLPIRRLDGGEVLALLVNKIFLPDTSERVTKAVSSSAVFLLWLMTVTFQIKYEINLTLLLFTIYLIYSEL